MRKLDFKPRGKISFNARDEKWEISAEPDIMIRLKRVFPRIYQSTLHTVTLRATEETSYELEWFLERFPMEITPEAQKHLRKSSRAFQQKTVRLQNLATQTTFSPVHELTLEPRQYQKYAAAVLLEKKSLLLADEIGLGKTFQAIMVMASGGMLPALVVVPTTLQDQWKREVEKCMPSASAHIIKSMKNYDLPQADVFICTYSKLSSWIDILGRFIKFVVFDEVHELRVPESAKYKAAKILADAMPAKLGISATPLFNWGSEIWNIYNILSPTSLGTIEEFTREWCDCFGGKSVVRDPAALGAYLRSNFLLLRRTKKEVGRELPSLIKIIHDVTLDAATFNKGLTAAEDLANIILSSSNFNETGRAVREFDLRLRQATGIAKAPYGASLIRMIVESGEKVVVGAWHRAVHDILREQLSDLNPVFVTGEETTNQKNASVEAFVNGTSKVIIFSNRSGAGLDGLQHVCKTLCILELEWTWKALEQLIGRVWRDGQDEPTTLYLPVCNVGSDPVMSNIIGLKQAQAAGIIEQGEKSNEFVSIDPERVKKLARDFLISRGKPIPERSSRQENDAAGIPTEPAVDTVQTELVLSA